MNTFTLGLIVIAYLLSLAYLGFLGYKKTSSASDYLVGGRQMNPFVMALSYGATFISASAIVGFGGVAAAFGMGIQWLCFLNMFIGVVIAFIFFGLRTRRMGAKLNKYISSIVRQALSFTGNTSLCCRSDFPRNAFVCRSGYERWCCLYRTDFPD